MSVPDTVTNFLRQNGIDFQVVSHEPTRHSQETAHVAHVPGGQLAKGVVLADDEQYVLAVVPSTRWVDLAAVERIVHKPVELVPEEDFPMLFRDCRPGAVPALGEAYGIMTIVDDELTEPGAVYFEAGDHEHLIRVNHEAFLWLIEPLERGRISTQSLI